MSLAPIILILNTTPCFVANVLATLSSIEADENPLQWMILPVSVVSMVSLVEINIRQSKQSN